MATNRVKADELCTFDSATLTGGGAYDVICDGLYRASFLIRIINMSNTSVMVSYDGAHNHDYVVAGDILQLSFQNNNKPRGHINLLPKDQIIYLSGPAGTGNIYLAAYYTEE